VRVDAEAALRGGALSLVVLVPAAVVGAVAEDGSALTSLSLLAVLGGFALAGGAAGRLAERDLLLPTGAAAAGGAYLAVQAVGVVLRLGRGEPVSWIAFPFLAMLAASIGMGASWLVGRRSEATEP
jgi:hypothetical protein